MQKAKCKISRRLGLNIFPKCAKVYARRPYPPGEKKKRPTPPLSEYGRQLREKQKLKYLYNLRERQFRNYVRKILERRHRIEDASSALMQLLERRLDNVVYRLGFATTRQQARQIVSHGHIMVNNRKVTIPSYQVKEGDEITIRPESRKRVLFQNIEKRFAKHKPPSWLALDPQKVQGKVISLPSFEEVAPPVDIASIFEFYSK